MVQVRLIILALLLALLPIGAACAAMQAISEGTYVDSQGGKHLWHVNDSHALVWGGRPYLPAGGLFQSRYLGGSQSDDEWNADAADLATLKSHGVTDIILMASGSEGLTRIPPEALQRMLDYLDANGFTYGLDIADFPRDPLDAFVINPAIYRAPAPEGGAPTTFRNIGGIASARYFLVSSRDGSIMTSGDASVPDSRTAVVSLDQNNGGDGTVLLLYPERKLTSGSLEGSHLPDIWSSSDSYRDQLLLYFSHIHFGKGLRFFADPIVDDLGFFGDAGEGMVPNSDAFRFKFQIWLLTHYGHNLPTLNNDWGLKEDQLPDFSVASRCIPLWYQDKGIGVLLDTGTDKQYVVDPAQSNVWDDIRQFREQSLRDEMNGLADSLKNGVADVPVVYRWTEPNPIFLNPQANSGYDGLLVVSADHGENIATNAAGYALADAEQAGRTQWLLAELSPRGLGPEGAPKPATADCGYTSRTVLTRDQSALQDIGLKGYYVDALRRVPDSRYAAINLLDAAPEQLDWLHQSAADMDVSSSSLSLQEPIILYYPTNISLPGIAIRQLDSGAWWLPTNDLGKAVDLGPGLEGYSMDQPGGGRDFVFWTNDGSVSTASFTLPKGSRPYVTTASGMVVTIVQKKDTFEIPVRSEPEEVAGLTDLPLPDGAVDASFKQVEKVIADAQGSHTPMDVFSQRLDYIRNSVLLEKNPQSEQLAYDMLHDTLMQLSIFLSPFIWIEGEDAESQNFGNVVSSAQASGHAYLWLDTYDDPPSNASGGYHADYTFDVTTPGSYNLWAALAPGAPGAGESSPITFSIDGGTAFNVLQPTTAGQPYGSLASAETSTTDGQFTWCQIGSQPLTPGQHTLSIVVTGKAPATGRYTLGIDCFCVTRATFRPDGTRKPALE